MEGTGTEPVFRHTPIPATTLGGVGRIADVGRGLADGLPVSPLAGRAVAHPLLGTADVAHRLHFPSAETVGSMPADTCCSPVGG